MDKICNIEVICTNSNGDNVVTTNVNIIHLSNFQNCDDWVQKLSSYVSFVSISPNCLENEIVHICRLAYQNGMNHEASHSMKRIA
jgi:hypothetical protein